ncbi:FAD binding domain-containing protein [Sulfurimonas sp. HSL3-7]|uniref:FAD binding domain-containing protein n=1 Tax=Sulfonitrofixus jiaomeiensis TaxID=3131938 RepID=UPI0031FA466A
MIYHRAEHLDDALNLIHQHPDFLLLCGSTDVAVQLSDQNTVQGLIDIGGLSELRAIEMGSESIHIGALATVTEIMESAAVRTHLPLLIAASEVFASHQIRNLATLGGNIANASPAADLTAVLLVLNATLTLGSKQGRREIALDELFCGYKCTKLDHEMILGITIPLQEHQWYYRKAGARERLNIAKVSLAVVKNSGGYCISGASLNPYALRLRHVEELLNSGDVSDEKISEALAQDIAPSGSFRSTKAYRTRVAFNMVKEAFSSLEAS